MKNIKTYESFYKKYQKDDYVVIKETNDRLHFGKIEDHNEITYMYRVYVFDISDIRWFYPDKIIRKMTPEEIEELNIKLDTTKYNL